MKYYTSVDIELVKTGQHPAPYEVVRALLAEIEDLRKAGTVTLPPPVAETGGYQDSTPELHVGESSFEDWFQSHPRATESGVKQIARDAYAAGMGDPLVRAAQRSPLAKSDIFECFSSTTAESQGNHVLAVGCKIANLVNSGGSSAAPECWCETCRPMTISDMRMVLCPDCGNKRCPKATDHRNVCTGSNAVGQKGSSWEHVEPTL